MKSPAWIRMSPSGTTSPACFPCVSLMQMIRTFAIVYKPQLLCSLHRQLPCLYMSRFCVCLDLHNRLNLVEVPGAKVVTIHSNVHRKGDRIVRQIAMRVPVKLPSSA